jgi:hypothetical protein
VSGFDCVLIDPTREEVVGALRGAATATGVLWPPDGLGAVLIRLDGELEGGHAWQASRDEVRALFIAWWHDYTGRNHVRFYPGRGGWADEAGPTPPGLAAVYPERSLVRRRGRSVEALALCPCGAWGDPWSIGWTGDCCGPCFDRREAPGGAPLPFPPAAGGTALVAAAPGGRFLAVLDGNGQISVWDTTEGRQSAEVSAGPGRVASLAVGPEGRFVAVARQRGETLALAVWDVAVGRQLLDAPLDSAGPAEVLVGQAALFVAVRVGDGTRLSRSDLPPRGALLALREDREPPALALSPDGSRLAVLEPRSGPVTLYDVPEARLVSRPQQRGWGFRRAAFTADGACVLASADGELGVGLTWADDGDEDPNAWLPWPNRGEIADLAFSPDGPVVAANDALGNCRAWRVPASHGDRAEVLATASAVGRCAFLADGRLLTFHPRRGVVNLWPAELFC